jgi:hypothetical protein
VGVLFDIPLEFPELPRHEPPHLEVLEEPIREAVGFGPSLLYGSEPFPNPPVDQCFYLLARQGRLIVAFILST